MSPGKKYQAEKDSKDECKQIVYMNSYNANVCVWI